MADSNSKYQIIVEALFDRVSLDKDIKRIQEEIKNKVVKIPVKLDVDTKDLDAKVSQAVTRSQRKQVDETQKMENRITRWKNSMDRMQAVSPVAFNTKEVQDQVKEVQSLFSLYRDGKKTVDDVQTGMSTLSTRVTQAGAAFRSTNKDGMGFTNMLSLALKKILIWTVGMTILYQVKNAIQSMISVVKELDSSLLEVQKVTDLEGESLKQFANNAFRVAEGLGRTGKEVIDAAAQFARAGYTIQESLDLSKSALIMMNVAEGIDNVQEATDVLIATMRGFNLEASDSAKIVDILNEVSNTTAINFDELAEGLQRTSGVLSQTGTSMEELSGLLVGGFEPLRNIEKVSSGLIMISQRLRGIGEDGEAIDGLMPKLQDEFEEIAGISILDPETGGLRSTYDLLSDMARVFPLLTGKQRQYLSELAAGNRQVSVLTAILNNWENVEKAIDGATNSLGSANKENEKYLDSIEGRLNKLKSTWQDLARDTINSDFIKVLVSIATALLEIIDNVGLFNSILIVLSVILSVKLGAGINFVTMSLFRMAAAMGFSSVAAAGLANGITGLVAALLVIGTIYVFKHLGNDIENITEKFKKATDTFLSNQDELQRIIDEYEQLANKQEKTKSDLIRLIELQSTLNSKYDGAQKGINLYSSAVDGNTEAIKNNIIAMSELKKFEAEEFLTKNRRAYEESTKYLKEVKPRGDFGKSQDTKLRGITGTAEEYLHYLGEQIGLGNDFLGILEKEWQRESDRINGAKETVATYEEQKSILEIIKQILEDMSKTEPVLEPSLMAAVELAEKLSASFYDVAESVRSMVDSYEGAALSLKEISQLQQMFPEDYLEALRIEEGQIYLNVDALKALITAKAQESYASAVAAQQIAEAEYVKANATLIATKNELDAHQAILDGLRSSLTAHQEYYTQNMIAMGLEQAAIQTYSNNYIRALQAIADAKAQVVEGAKRVNLAFAVFESFQTGTAWINDNTDALNANAGAAGGLSDAEEALIKAKEKEIKALEKEKKALQERLKEYKKYIDAQKEALKLKKEEADFNAELLKKEEDLAELKAKIALLALDDSEEAMAERLRLEEEAAKLEEEIAEDKADRIYDLQIEALDRLADAFEDGINKQIDAIDDLIEKLREAIELIRETSTGGGGGGGGSGGGGGGGSGVGGGGMDWDGFFRGLKNTFKLSQEEIDRLVRWKNGYLKVGMGLEEIIRHLTETARGWQYWRLQEGVGEGEGDPEHPYFHSGGIVESHHSGDFAGNLKSNEVFAKLLKGEYVATQAQMNNFMKNTLPKMASYKSVSKDITEGSITMNMPITVEGNLDSSTIPEIKKIANQVVMEINKSIIARGNIRSANQTVS